MEAPLLTLHNLLLFSYTSTFALLEFHTSYNPSLLATPYKLMTWILISILDNIPCVINIYTSSSDAVVANDSAVRKSLPKMYVPHQQAAALLFHWQSKNLDSGQLEDNLADAF